MVDGLDIFQSALPGVIQKALRDTYEDVEQVTIRLGYPLLVTGKNGKTKIFDGKSRVIDGRDQAFPAIKVAREHLEYMGPKITGIRSDGRGGIDGTLHRVASIQNREEKTLGYQIRIARHVTGLAEPFRKLVEFIPSSSDLIGPGILVIGKPRIGKTTFLRDLGRIAAPHYGPLAVVIDTSCELGGVADVPIPELLPMMVLQVPDKKYQEKILRRGIVNYGPEMLMIDEIATLEEALQIERARTFGVRPIGTVHGGTLADACRRDVNRPLLGISNVTGKRELPAVFDVAIEIVERNVYRLYKDLNEAVTSVLEGRVPKYEEVRVEASAVLAAA
jgi:stage III sporulation protein SpoIIIAA